jgi:hypothetical protein
MRKIKNLKLEPFIKKEIIIADNLIEDVSYVRKLTVGDIMNGRFEIILENHKPYTFFVHYSTVRGDALGKLILTDYEIIFEPFNQKLKGFINQDSFLKS